MALIVFDYDGVLIDSRPSWAHAFKKTSEKYGFKHSFDEIVEHFGPKTETVLRSLIDGDEERVKDAKDFIDNLLQTDEILSRSSVPPEVNTVIKALKLKGHTLVILTNGDKAFLDASLDYFSVNKSAFKELIPAEREIDSKEDTIKHLMEKYDFNSDNTYYIGDRGHDADVAKKAGCKGIVLLKYGWDTKESVIKHSPDSIIHSLDEVLDVID